MKNSLLSTYSTNILVLLLSVDMNNFLTPKIRIVRTHSSNSIETSGTSPLGSYKEVPPPPFREFEYLHVSESKTVLDSGFQNVDPRFEVMGPGFSVKDSRFLQLYSGLQSPKFRIP